MDIVVWFYGELGIGCMIGVCYLYQLGWYVEGLFIVCELILVNVYMFNELIVQVQGGMLVLSYFEYLIYE